MNILTEKEIIAGIAELCKINQMLDEYELSEVELLSLHARIEELESKFKYTLKALQRKRINLV